MSFIKARNKVETLKPEKETGYELPAIADAALYYDLPSLCYFPLPSEQKVQGSSFSKSKSHFRSTAGKLGSMSAKLIESDISCLYRMYMAPIQMAKDPGI